MTTFQEPQPQSRRAVRQSERGDAPEQGPFTAAPGQPPFSATTPQYLPSQGETREMWDTTARRAAQLPPAPAEQPATSGRRSAAPRPSAPGSEPLMYSTQQRAAAPAPEAPAFRPRNPAPRPEPEAQPATQQLPQADQPTYRVRDFSPEGRRAAPADPAWAQQTAPAPSDLDYHTEVRFPGAVPAAPGPPIAQVPPMAEPVASAPPQEQTLSRRELRAMQQAEEAAALPAQPAASAPYGAPAASPQPQYSGPQAPIQQAPIQQAPVQKAPIQQAPIQPAPIQQAPADGAQPWPFADLGFADPSRPPAAGPMPTRAPEPAANTGLTNALAEFDSLAVSPPQAAAAPQLIDSVPPMVSNGPRTTPPTGHWSVQAELEDETQPYESTINRTVGNATATTSALVLPTAPIGSDIRGALTSTGEIMLTGSIDLPHSYSSTGATSSLDHHAMDAFFDSHDAEVITTDSAPVRAIKAVSTHNSGQGVTHTQKPKGTRALTALIIVAASMAVLVAGLLAAALVLNIF